MNNTDLHEKLASLIDEERDALISGNFDRIAELMEVKESLVSDLRERNDMSENIGPLRDGLRRNQELFDHALAGLRNVANRIGEVSRTRKSLETYDEHGARINIASPTTKKLERKA